MFQPGALMPSGHTAMGLNAVIVSDLQLRIWAIALSWEEVELK